MSNWVFLAPVLIIVNAFRSRKAKTAAAAAPPTPPAA